MILVIGIEICRETIRALKKKRDKLDERQLRNLKNIDTSAHNLLNLINEILDLSRVEAGSIDVHPESIDLQPLVIECAAVIEPLIQAEVQLIQEIEAVPTLRTDREILRKVLMNILDPNKITYFHCLATPDLIAIAIQFRHATRQTCYLANDNLVSLLWKA